MRRLLSAFLVWLNLATLALAQSAPSSITLSGNSGGNAPAASSGNEGNFFLDYSSGKVYQKSFGAWTSVGTIGGSGSGVSSLGNATSDTSLTLAGTGAGPYTGAVTAALNLNNPQTWTGIQTFTTPALGAATGTSLALGGATLGANIFAVTGSALVTGNMNITSGQLYSINNDVILSRHIGANWQLGATDAAAPVAQTLGVQSVIAGTADTAGVNWTNVGSLSTGAGVSGDIIFQTGGTGAGSTVQNSKVTALTIKGATQVVNVTPVGSAAAPSLSIGNLTTGLYSVSTTGFCFADVNGTCRADYGITNSGNITLNTTTVNFGGSISAAAGSINVQGSGAMSFNVRGIITSPAAGDIQIGNTDAAAPIAQTLSVQNVVAGTSNTAGVNETIVGSLSTASSATSATFLATTVASDVVQFKCMGY